MGKPTKEKPRYEQPTPPRPQAEASPARAVSGSSPRTAAVEAIAPAAGRARPGHEQIAHRAYQLWESQGCPEGCDLDHWFEAERMLLAAMR